jgi:hypothetical protein
VASATGRRHGGAISPTAVQPLRHRRIVAVNSGGPRLRDLLDP